MSSDQSILPNPKGDVGRSGATGMENNAVKSQEDSMSHGATAGGHTPGPWHLGEPTIYSNHGFKVHGFPISGGGQAIAAVWNGSVGKEYVRFGNQEANACLIAAAPDMLAALRDAVVLIESIPLPVDISPALLAALHKRRDAIRAAIAKATQKAER